VVPNALLSALQHSGDTALHWGTFKLTDEPPARIARTFEEHGHAPPRLWVLDIGETRLL